MEAISGLQFGNNPIILQWLVEKACTPGLQLPPAPLGAGLTSLSALGRTSSSVINLATGSPQGCVLVTLMTDDCLPSSVTSHIVKVLDDTTVVGLINNLILNVDNTEEFVNIKTRRSSPLQQHWRWSSFWGCTSQTP